MLLEVRIKGMDWNRDGKYDWKDDAFYNNVTDNKENGQNQEKLV